MQEDPFSLKTVILPQLQTNSFPTSFQLPYLSQALKISNLKAEELSLFNAATELWPNARIALRVTFSDSTLGFSKEVPSNMT
jgi:hypothetical protein